MKCVVQRRLRHWNPLSAGLDDPPRKPGRWPMTFSTNSICSLVAGMEDRVLWRHGVVHDLPSAVITMELASTTPSSRWRSPGLDERDRDGLVRLFLRCFAKGH